MTTIAAFDLGIKNLSYCVASFDASGCLLTVDRWANLNLLADGADSQSQTRCSCSGPASWIDSDTGILLCKKCVKKGKSLKSPLVIEATTVAGWRTWATSTLGLSETEAKKRTKKALEEQAAAKFLMPYKAPKAKGVTLQSLLASMETCLTAELGFLKEATRIRIENQPSEFAPHMKSIQIMLFTLLDHRLRVEHGWTGTMEFVNASVKTRGLKEAGVGKDAKRSRKLAGISRVTEALTKVPACGSQLTWWSGQAKQDDLADALLMCLDGSVISHA
jgi:hypothetical protein